ncbi:MAG TPA: hypothetical protein VFN67_10070 [Polyangiales bacterium]|nr:hypothetical protein [Polyangiales bacterium]
MARYLVVVLLALAACNSPPKETTKQTESTTVALMNATLALTSVPGTPPVNQQRAKDLLLKRADAMAMLSSEFNRLPANNIGRWHLIRLIGACAERGDQAAIRFLLRESLVPDPPPQGHSHEIATSDVPEEVMVKLEAASALVLALIANAAGAAEAVNELLRESDAWLAKTIAIQMGHDHMMDQTYSSIMADRGFASRFRDATDEEVRARSTVSPQNLSTNDPPPPAL